MTFAQPSQGGQGGDQFDAKDHRGHLLLVYPKGYLPEVQTKNGPSSAADVDVIIVDKFGPDGRPMSFINARLFGNLANSVRNDVGGQVLGRLDQIQTQGGRTPWVLQNFTDADQAAATPVHTAYQQGQFQPTPNPMAPANVMPPQGHQAPPAYNAAPSPVPAAQQWAPPLAASQPQMTSPPPAQQWQQQAAPPAPAPAAPAPAPATAAPAVDPNLAAFLASKGVQVTPGMTQQQAEAIAAAFPQ